MVKPKCPVNQNQETRKLIKLVTKELWYTRMQLQTTVAFDRKSDSRKKIILGGLFVKAGLDYLHPDNTHILYGMLLDCKEQLIIKPKIIDKWKSKGRALLISKH